LFKHLVFEQYGNTVSASDKCSRHQCIRSNMEAGPYTRSVYLGQLFFQLWQKGMVGLKGFLLKIFLMDVYDPQYGFVAVYQFPAVQHGSRFDTLVPEDVI